MSIVGPPPLAIHHCERDLAPANVAHSIYRSGILGFRHIRKGTFEMGVPQFEHEYINEYALAGHLAFSAPYAWSLWKGLQVVLECKRG